jgi:ParB family chromosome partitioning protein
VYKRQELQVIENKTVKTKIDANVKAAETKLRRHLGTQVQIIPDGKGTGGKIDIEYYSDSDLDRIYNLLMVKE